MTFSLPSARAASLIAAAAGLVGSVVLMRRGGNPPAFLILIMAVWVAGPFLALVWANAIAKRWPAPLQTALYRLTVAVTFVTLAIYAYRIAYPPPSTGAFVFVLVPPVTVAVIAVVAMLTRSRWRGGSSNL